MTFNSKKLTLVIGTTVMIIAGILILPKEQESTPTASSKPEVITKSVMQPLKVEPKDMLDTQSTHQNLKKREVIEENHLTSKEVMTIEEETQEEKNPTTLSSHHLHQPSPKEREAMLLRRIAHQDREKKMKMIEEKLHAEHEEKLNNQ